MEYHDISPYISFVTSSITTETNKGLKFMTLIHNYYYPKILTQHKIILKRTKIM